MKGVRSPKNIRTSPCFNKSIHKARCFRRKCPQRMPAKSSMLFPMKPLRQLNALSPNTAIDFSLSAPRPTNNPSAERLTEGFCLHLFTLFRHNPVPAKALSVQTAATPTDRKTLFPSAYTARIPPTQSSVSNRCSTNKSPEQKAPKCRSASPLPQESLQQSCLCRARDLCLADHNRHILHGKRNIPNGAKLTVFLCFNKIQLTVNV